MRHTQHFIVSGRVQGVGFRAATCDTARALHLDGWVRNRPDGTVEVVAAGSESALDTLHDWLARGPGPARVAHVSRHDAADCTGAAQGFAIM